MPQTVWFDTHTHALGWRRVQELGIVIHAHTCQVHQVELRLEELGGFAICRGVWLAPLVHSQGENSMRPAGLLIQVM